MLSISKPHNKDAKKRMAPKTPLAPKSRMVRGLYAAFSLIMISGLATSQTASAQHMQGDAGHMGGMKNMTPPPIGFMGSMLSKKGQVMTSLKYKRIDMKGLLDGDTKISIDDALADGYRGIPMTLSAEMLMIGGMYGLTDKVSLGIMIPRVEKEMTMRTYNMAGTALVGESSAKVSGLGDIKIGAHYKLYKTLGHVFNAGLSLSLPTGSIDEDVTMLMMNGMQGTKRGSYSMQIGSGTYDLLPSLTYSGHQGDISWGAQYQAVLRLEDENDEGYRRGHVHKGQAWLAYKWLPWLSSSAGLSAFKEGGIKGADPLIFGKGVGANPDNFGGERVDLVLGLNMKATSGPLKGTRVGVEYSTPLYEKHNGTRLSVEHGIMVGITKKF